MSVPLNIRGIAYIVSAPVPELKGALAHGLPQRHKKINVRLLQRFREFKIFGTKRGETVMGFEVPSPAHVRFSHPSLRMTSQPFVSGACNSSRKEL